MPHHIGDVIPIVISYLSLVVMGSLSSSSGTPRTQAYVVGGAPLLDSIDIAVWVRVYLQGLVVIGLSESVHSASLAIGVLGTSFSLIPDLCLLVSLDSL